MCVCSIGFVLLPVTVGKQLSLFLRKTFTNHHHPLLQNGIYPWEQLSHKDSVPYDWHSWLLVDFLLEHGLHFTPLSTETVHLGNATRAGGIFFVGGEEVNKGHVIHQVVPAGHMAVLIDNTYDKLLRARSSSSCRFQGVHFTAAHGLESDDESRQRWLCEQLAQIGRRCKSCGQEL